ncbi:MAG: hypothetical protein MUF87_18670 [Anaerolineae bacterium]|jgi:hypothetical protein|nr:hypothetical protein [Anaerolineae bacterium]
MVLLVMFIFGAMLLGTGAMLSPAWFTSQPRIGLTATFALALIIGGAIFWAMAFGWNTLVVDYILFALITGIFLRGTLSFGQARAEQRGEILSDAEQGWTGPEDLLFFAFVALGFAIPALILQTPADPTALPLAYMALSAKLGGSFDTYAPFNPAIAYSYAPGFSALSAYLSEQLNLNIASIQLGISAVIGFLGIWLAYDFGSEIRDKRLGRAMAIAALLGFGVITLYFRGDFTALLGVVFALAFWVYAYRYQQHGHLLDLIAAGLMIGAVSLVHLALCSLIALAYLIWVILLNFSQPRPPIRRLIAMIIAVPVIAIIATLPYLARAFNALDLTPYRDSWGILVADHGLLIFIAALIGVGVSLRQRQAIGFLAVAFLPALLVLPLSYGLVIPLTVFGGIGLLYLWEQAIAPRLPHPRLALILAVIGLVLWAGNLARILPASPVTDDDRAALAWLEANTPPDALILNTPTAIGWWTPIISERAAVYSWIQPDDRPAVELWSAPPPEVDYLFLQSSNAIGLPIADGFTLVFESGLARIYARAD